MYKDNKFILFCFLTWLSSQNLYYGISNFVTKSWQNVIFLKINKSNSYTLYNNIGWLFNKVQNLNIPIPKFMNVKGKKILFVGRITRLKGYDILFHSVKHDLERFNWHLFFVGNKELDTKEEQEIFQNINNDILKLKIRDRVHFIPFSDNVIQYMKSCDLVVHPTLFEGFGLVILEAMRLKIPIITTDVEAIPEIINDVGICMLKPFDTDGFKNKIYRYLEHQNINDLQIIEKSYVRSLQFNLENRISRFLEIINKK